MTLRNDNLFAAVRANQTSSSWSLLAASRLTRDFASTFGTGVLGCFVPSPAYQSGQGIAKNYPAPPIAFALCPLERCP